MNLNEIYKKDKINLPENLDSMNNFEFKVKKVEDFS